MVFKKKEFNKFEILEDYAIISAYDKNNNLVQSLVDKEILEKLIDANYYWFASYRKGIDNYYLQTNIYYKENHKRYHRVITLHQFVMNYYYNDFTFHVDHIDCKHTLDNRKSNLRIIKANNNLKNRKSRNSNNKSGHRNVCRIGNRWYVQLQVDGKNTVLKTFPLNELKDAGEFAEEMRRKYYGEFAGSN